VRQEITLKMGIEAREYLAIGLERTARQSEDIQGRANTAIAIKDRENRAKFLDEATHMRQQLHYMREDRQKQDRLEMAGKLGGLADQLAKGNLGHLGQKPTDDQAQKKPRANSEEPAWATQRDDLKTAEAEKVRQQTQDTNDREGLKPGEPKEGKGDNKEARQANAEKDVKEIKVAWSDLSTRKAEPKGPDNSPPDRPGGGIQR